MERYSFDREVDILIIGDAHAKPGVSSDRFHWAGQYAADTQPDVIVDMGDWADMESLCSYDRGLKSYEGRKYIADVTAAREARSRFRDGIEELNDERRAAHRKRYQPVQVALGGNHDYGRISKAIESDRKLEGLIHVSDLGAEEYGWDTIPYLQPCEIAGFFFSHFFVSGVMGRPVSGEMPSLQLIRKHLSSCVQAHSHLFDIAHRTRPDGKRVWGLVAGCYLAPDQWEDYAGPANPLWWKGLILLKGCRDGDFTSIETQTIDELRNRYG